MNSPICDLCGVYNPFKTNKSKNDICDECYGIIDYGGVDIIETIHHYTHITLGKSYYGPSIKVEYSCDGVLIFLTHDSLEVG